MTKNQNCFQDKAYTYVNANRQHILKIPTKLNVINA